jgi:hypothetical protein
MQRGVESLNAAARTAVLLFECVRQRTVPRREGASLTLSECVDTTRRQPT